MNEVHFPCWHFQALSPAMHNVAGTDCTREAILALPAWQEKGAKERIGVVRFSTLQALQALQAVKGDRCLLGRFSNPNSGGPRIQFGVLLWKACVQQLKHLFCHHGCLWSWHAVEPQKKALIAKDVENLKCIAADGC